MAWNEILPTVNTWSDATLTNNAWQQGNITDNAWNELNYVLYVFDDYWVNGYTIDVENAWSGEQQSQNEWVVIG